ETRDDERRQRRRRGHHQQRDDQHAELDQDQPALVVAVAERHEEEGAGEESAEGERRDPADRRRVRVKIRGERREHRCLVVDRPRAREHRNGEQNHQPAVANAGRSHDGRTLKDRIPLCTPSEEFLSRLAICFVASLAFASAASAQQPVEPVLSLVKKEKQPFLDTLKQLVSIETGTRDLEGLEKAAYLIAGRLQALGGKVELVDPPADAYYRMADTPPKVGKIVHATFEGKGKKRILLLAHMDTVYLHGMLAKQPFRVDRDRAWGLGIVDDKQGVALILHTVAILKEMDFRDYGLITVLINADEEMSSPGSRRLITREGERHDAVFSCESTRVDNDKLALATAGIASVVLRVKGRAA